MSPEWYTDDHDQESIAWTLRHLQSDNQLAFMTSSEDLYALSEVGKAELGRGTVFVRWADIQAERELASKDIEVNLLIHSFRNSNDEPL